MLIYIVRRESADGPENDCFEDHELATQWANIIGGVVEEERTIDKIVLDELRKSYCGNTCDHSGCDQPSEPEDSAFCLYHHDHEDAEVGNPPEEGNP